MQTAGFAVYDSGTIWGLGDTQAEAYADARSWLDLDTPDADIDRLHCSRISPDAKRRAWNGTLFSWCYRMVQGETVIITTEEL